MLSLIFPLFAAGLLTILLPCILPLVPIVLGVSVGGRNMWRPFVTIMGMLVGFVAITFVLQVFLSQFVELADDIRIATFDVLFLFGVGFLFHKRLPQVVGALLGGFFFLEKGWIAVAIAIVLNIVAMELAGRVGAKIQQFGGGLQQQTRSHFGDQSLLSSFLIGLTMGFVWVPCAGPALGFALTLVRNQPGFYAFLLLAVYAVGAGIPLLLIGYGGQAAIRSVHAISPYIERIKEAAGVLFILSAIAMQFQWFTQFQTWLADNTSYGNIGTNLEEKIFGNRVGVMTAKQVPSSTHLSSAQSSTPSMTASDLPIIGRAPEFTGLGPWHNSSPLSLASLKGKVVLVDFWTYSCINCIRTLPYEQATWEKFKGQPFVLIGVHTPEFTFEKSETNVAMAIKEHGLTYPVAQDNDYGTWNAFSNQYWPAKYLIDQNGNIRYVHFGEGAYDETDQAIAFLLGVTYQTASSSARQQADQPLTPETYLHSRGWSSFANAQGAPNAAVHTYVAPSSLDLNQFSLSGAWQLVSDERQVLQSDEGQIRIHALAGEVNLVLGLEQGIQPVSANVWIDGVKSSSFTIDRHDLFTLFKGTYGEHDVVLKIHGKGVGAYAFTFGS